MRSTRAGMRTERPVPSVISRNARSLAGAEVGGGCAEAVRAAQPSSIHASRFQSEKNPNAEDAEAQRAQRIAGR